MICLSDCTVISTVHGCISINLVCLSSLRYVTHRFCQPTVELMLLIVTDRFLGCWNHTAVASSPSHLLSHTSEFLSMLPMILMTGVLQLTRLELGFITSTTPWHEDFSHQMTSLSCITSISNVKLCAMKWRQSVILKTKTSYLVPSTWTSADSLFTCTLWYIKETQCHLLLSDKVKVKAE